MTQEALAARALVSARVLVVTAGAGMGVDSGLPDFRGDAGFWKAYPPYERLGITFIEAANPLHFRRDPAFGWGFYGHRLRLYRETEPHAGFALIRDWIQRFHLDCFVVTSNVDGQFQKAGFAPERLHEVHGSIHHLQCLQPCGDGIWDNEEAVPVDEALMRAKHIPMCPSCGDVARPNILMFGDFSWLPRRSSGQGTRFQSFWKRAAGQPAVVLEIGAGTHIPTIRRLSEQLTRGPGQSLVRINPREADVPKGQIGLRAGALQGLLSIERELERLSQGPATGG
jgi:NAD-dependent SIR2 family protein deacetylase